MNITVPNQIIYCEIPNNQAMNGEFLFECFTNTYTYGLLSTLHYHSFSEIIYVNYGSLEIRINNNVMRLFRGDLIYVNPIQTHRLCACDEHETRLTIIKFNPALLSSSMDIKEEKNLLYHFLEGSVIQYFYFADHDIRETSIREKLDIILKEADAKRIAYEYAIRNYICGIILDLLRILANKDELDFDAERYEQLREVLVYIKSNFNTSIKMDEILKLCNLSYSNFALKFKTLTGKTFTNYVSHMRISHAQLLLISTQMSMIEIAEKCGFNDICYFNRVFKRISGEAPYKFKKHSQEYHSQEYIGGLEVYQGNTVTG